jgi:putative DNA primase/helicase
MALTTPVQNVVPQGLGPRPPGTFRADPPKRPHLNVIRFLEAHYSEDGKWTLIWYRDEFHVWVGSHWRAVSEATMQAEVYDVFKNAVFVGSIGTGQAALPAWQDFDPDPAKMNALMQGLKNECLLDQGVDMPEWLEDQRNIVHDPNNRPAGANPHDVIACQNGLLYTVGRQLWAHTPRYLNAFAVSYPYLASAPAPQEWLTFLKSVWPDDQESIDTLQEWFGYFLTQRNDQQKMLMLYGAKRGGKGTIIRVLTALMGADNVTGTSIADLNHGDFGLASLEGKQLAVMSDVRFRSRDDGTAVERLLKITGNDAVLINKKFKQPYTAHLTTRFLMASNELPKMADESGALTGRIMLLRFKQSFYGREDLDLERRLMLELPGILNWSLDGLDRLNARGKFVQPQSGIAELNVIEDLGSPTLAFLKDCCVQSPAGLVKYDELWGVWKLWAQDNGVMQGSKITLTKSVRAGAPGVDIVKRGPAGKQLKHWEGLALSEQGMEYANQLQMTSGFLGGNSL